MIVEQILHVLFVFHEERHWDEYVQEVSLGVCRLLVNTLATRHVQRVIYRHAAGPKLNSDL